ncbi:hypothetical protein L6164_030275 [Bauhinia variegata]|uniref:Uncharacterized protein n=1 Tax=Bauhinia variegata TaxID=167791 RepID=A0ACB9LBR4_BAUVA|nr:hypothetical protein L6164_030275 [Bauhinia variegata]
MFNGDSSMPPVTSVLTEQIQKYLEENQQLILAIMECRKLGKFSDMCKCQNKLQYNLSYLAKVADAQPQAQTESQLLSQFVSQREQGIQYPHKALSRQQLDLSSWNMPFQMNDHCQQKHYGAFSLQCNTFTTDQQHQQHHAPISSQQLDQSTSKSHFQMNCPQLQRHVAISPQQLDSSTSKLPFQMFDQQHQQCHAEIFVQQPDESTPKFQMNNQQKHHVVMYPQQPDASISKLPLMMNDQQQQFLVAFSQQRSDVSASKLPFQMIDSQQKHHKQPAFFQQQRLVQGPMNSLPGTNCGVYQASESRLGINLSDTQENNQFNTDSQLLEEQ